MRLRSVAFLGLVYLGTLPGALAATGGDVDPSFAYPNPAQAIPDSTNAVGMPDGGLIVITSRADLLPASTSTLDLARIDANGAPVAAFGSPDGRLRVTLPLRLNVSLAAARDAAGNILLGGHEIPADPVGARNAALIRLGPQGELDQSFGNQGLVLFDAPAGRDDRFEQVATLPDGRIVAGVNVTSDRFLADWSCDTGPELASLLIFDSTGHLPAVLTELDNTRTGISTCANTLTLRVQSDGEILIGNRVGIRALQPPDYRTVIPLPDPPRTSSFGGTAGTFLAGMVAAYVDGGLVRIYYDDRNEPNRGLWVPHRSVVDPPGLPLTALAGFDVQWELTVTSIEQASFGMYVGFSDSGWAGVARFNADGSVGTDWGGGDGVVPVPAVSATEGAGQVRKLYVQPNDDVIVVTSNGFVRKLLGPTGVAHGGFALERQPGVPESAATYVLRVSRTGGSTGAASVSYRVSADCDAAVAGSFCPQGQYTPATAGVDFEAASGELFWGDGETGEKTIAVRVLDDAEPESVVEYFFVQLLNPTGGAAVLAGTTDFPINPIVQAPPPPPPDTDQPTPGSRTGGGAFGWMTLLLLLGLTSTTRVRRGGCPFR